MKLFSYLILAALAVYILVYFVRFRWVLYAMPNPVIVQKDAEFGDPTKPVLRYIAAGDSTALGSGASSVEHTYPYKIAEHLSKNNHVLYKNIGISGARLQDFREVQLPQIIAYKPDVITISIGGNNVDRLASQEYILQNLKAIITEITTHTSATLYLANLPNFTGAVLVPHPYVWLLEARSKPMNAAIMQLESDRVKIANIHDFFGAETDVKHTYSADHFHPSDFGYEFWTKAFIAKISE